MLVLGPLLLITLTLITVAAYDRILASRSTLAEQHAMLVEARKAAVRNVIEAAMSSIAPIVANAGANDLEAQEQAKNILRRFRFDESNYVFVYDYQGKVLVQPMMPDREGTNGLDTQDRNGKPLIRDMIEIARQGGGFYQYAWPHPATGEIEAKHSYAAGVQKWGWLVGAGVYATDIDAAMAAIEATETSAQRQFIIKTVLIGSAIFMAVAAIAIWLVRRTVQPIRRTANAMQDIAKGNGDLTRRLEIESDDEIGELANQFNAFVARMQDTLREVRASTLSVYQAAGDIAQGSEELASRTEQAAANLQQTSASMEEITSTVNNSAESAQQANQLVLSTAAVARQGEAAMSQVEHTMNDIDASAAKIGDIVSMIDSIAFQTNILALNASVEAARAGEHGRGFAVVAQEVRILANRSSEASREIRALIDDSVSHTQSGAGLVRTAGQTMRDIATRVARVTAVIGEISTGAKEQSSGIAQVNTAVAEMDTMTQRNAAMVQQSATAAADMRLHAERLNRLIDTFVLGEEEAPTQGPHKTSPAAASRTTAVTRSSRTPIGQRSSREATQEWETF
ncbi:methyl-accepting chemotaxis protein [Halomonas shantousis]